MNWRAVYHNGDVWTEQDGPYSTMPRSGLKAFQIVHGDYLVLETVPPKGDDWSGLRYRRRSEMRTDGLPGDAKLVVGWVPSGPAYLVGTDGSVWESASFHDSCDETCNHPHGWFDAPVPIDTEIQDLRRFH
jgi:hypothetical protein